MSLLNLRGLWRCLPGLALSVACAAQADDGVRALEAQRHGQVAYRFPVLTGDDPATHRINTYLHAVWLDALFNRMTHEPFGRVTPAEEEHGGLIGMDYAVTYPAPGYLEVNIHQAGMGAYITEVDTTQAFDRRTGQPIGLRQLLSPAGLTALTEEVAATRLERMRAFAKGQVVTDGPGGQKLMLRTDPEEADIQRQMYQDCQAWRGAETVVRNQLVLGAKALTLSTEGCAPHVVAALDDLGEMPVVLSYASLQPWLSSYGQCLLVEQRADCRWPADLSTGGTYQGTIDGRYPITLVLEPMARFRGGVYFYDKHALPILLTVQQRTASTIQLGEEGDPPARFDLQLTPEGTLRGTWQQTGRRGMAVELR